MKREQTIALQITFSILIFFALFGSVFLFIYSDSVSLKDFFYKLFEKKVIFGRDVFYFYTYVGIKTIAILFGIYFISYFFLKKYLSHIAHYNNKLKDYNHYLAHELKTPISIIYSNLDVLKYGFDEKKITDSQIELKNMLKIIDGLLNFSETIQISNKKDINLENFIKNYIYFLEGSDNITIINKEFNFTIETDEVLFLRVIKNLIENALKYSLDGKLNIYIKNDKLIFENKIFATLEKEEIKNLFKKFYSKSYNENKGSGIGLAMIKEIVKVLGYEMIVISKDDKFIVELIY